MPAHPSCAASVRRTVATHLTSWHLSHLIDDAVLATDELFANAVSHAGAGPADSVAVVLEHTGHELRVTVSDPSPLLPRPRTPAEAAESGRGLSIVAALADDWGTAPPEPGTPGKKVWFSLVVEEETRRPIGGRENGMRSASPMESAGGSAAEPRQAAQAALAAELVRRAEEDQRLTRLAREAPTSLNRHFVTRCRSANADALRVLVARRGWPEAGQVGEDASTAALMILLHTADLGFQLTCRDLIAEAVADGGCPAVHHAYIADHCAVELGQPQFYGTRIDADTLCPYPIRRPETVEERRQDVGLDPLVEQLPALRQVVSGIPDSR